MVSLETLTNFRIQLHMFVYPQHIDLFLNEISCILSEYNTGGYYSEYDSKMKQVIIKLVDRTHTLEVQNKINNAFAEFLNREEVKQSLRKNINDKAFNDYLMITTIRQNYLFLYNATVLNISSVNDVIIIQL